MADCNCMPAVLCLARRDSSSVCALHASANPNPSFVCVADCNCVPAVPCAVDHHRGHPLCRGRRTLPSQPPCASGTGDLQVRRGWGKGSGLGLTLLGVPSQPPCPRWTQLGGLGHTYTCSLTRSLLAASLTRRGRRQKFTS